LCMCLLVLKVIIERMNRTRHRKKGLAGSFAAVPQEHAANEYYQNWHVNDYRALLAPHRR
jgi:hypothetical protein